MSNAHHNDCYGTMFPTTLQARSDRPMRGKVFAFTLSTAGGTFRSGRQVSADIEAWDVCVGCEDFEPCYRLSLGKLALETAIGEK